MKAEKVQQLNSLWNETTVYKWICLLAEGKKEEAEEYKAHCQEEFEKKHKSSSLSCMDAMQWEEEKIADGLCSEFNTWNEYIEYLKTFSDKEIEVMYELDVFDSYMAKRLSERDIF